ncbi:MAG: protein-disulfide reductase DsbD domain-containing protein [Planctomycetota bacterium]
MKPTVSHSIFGFSTLLAVLLVVSTALADFPMLQLTPPNAVRDGRVEAELISQYDALVPGETAKVGLRLKMDEGWHTYWKNPGDSGLATSIDWDLPEGFEASPTLWPAPDYFEVGGLASFGYEGEIVLPLMIKVPEHYEGKRVTLRATADWLVCKSACEAGSADLSLELPLVSDPDEAVVDPSYELLFAQAARDLPIPAASHVAVGLVKDGRYLLSIYWLATAISNPKNATARFFPEDPLVIAMAAPQKLTPVGDEGFIIEMIPNLQAPNPPDRLRGVVVYQNGDQKFVYQIDTPIRDVADRE